MSFNKPVLALSPQEYGMYLIMRAVIGLAAFLVPFLLIDGIAKSLGTSVGPIVSFLGNFILFPALLSFLFHRVQQRVPVVRTAYFWYAGFFVVFGAFIGISGLRTGNWSNLAGSVIVLLIGVGMLYFAFWSTRQQRAQTAAADGAAYEAAREEQIQIQTEAILRAERMRQRS